MRENELIEIIKSVIGGKYIGDDCAYLEDLGIVISQDSLVEDVHFDMRFISAYQLGYKSAAVNISDISASGAKPAYMTTALSLPKNISNEFVKEFYLGLTDAGRGITVVGGDLTASDKITISIAIIGTSSGRKISSRAAAKEGYVLITSGFHGSSAAGLRLLKKNKIAPAKFIQSHLMPEIKTEFSSGISKNINCEYAMIDSSDGLADALYKIAQAGDKTLTVDFDKIPYDKELKRLFPKDYKDLILYGGEDYEIIAAVPPEFAAKYTQGIKIGYVEERNGNVPIKLVHNGETEYIYNIDKCFRHF